MDKKLEFNEALSALIEYATVNGSIITTKDVKEYFKDIIADDAQYMAVYKYLVSTNIKISDMDIETEPDSVEIKAAEDTSLPNSVETEEGTAFLNMYFDELKSIKKEKNDDSDHLIKASMDGDKDAINKLTELHLDMVIKVADEFSSSPLRKSDLIGTGNVALFEAIISYDGSEKDYETYLENYVRNAIKNAETEEINSVRIFNHVADRANALSDATTELAKELEREATLEELCEKLSLSEEEVRNVMKMSLEAINKEW